MVEIETPNFYRDIERIEGKSERPLISPKNEKKYSSSAKSVKGLILGLLAKFRADLKHTPDLKYTPNELITIFEESLRKYEDVKYAKKLITIDIIEGWQNGTDKLDIWKGITNDFLIESHAKSKEDGTVNTNRYEIKHEAVNKLLFYIKSWQVGESHKCYDFAEVLGFQTWKDLWRERKIYFSDYYFVVKILEKLGLIKYSGRGTITRFK